MNPTVLFDALSTIAVVTNIDKDTGTPTRDGDVCSFHRILSTKFVLRRDGDLSGRQRSIDYPKIKRRRVPYGMTRRLIFRRMTSL